MSEISDDDKVMLDAIFGPDYVVVDEEDTQLPASDED